MELFAGQMEFTKHMRSAPWPIAVNTFESSNITLLRIRSTVLWFTMSPNDLVSTDPCSCLCGPELEKEKDFGRRGVAIDILHHERVMDLLTPGGFWFFGVRAQNHKTDFQKDTVYININQVQQRDLSRASTLYELSSVISVCVCGSVAKSGGQRNPTM